MRGFPIGDRPSRSGTWMPGAPATLSCPGCGAVIELGGRDIDDVGLVAGAIACDRCDWADVVCLEQWLAYRRPMMPTRRRDWQPVTLREALADYAHEAWSGWMRYVFAESEEGPDGTVVVPAWAVKRWNRQIATRYCDLPKTEQDSDRAEADKIIAILSGRQP